MEALIAIADDYVEEAEGALEQTDAITPPVPAGTRKVYADAVDDARALRDGLLDLRDALGKIKDLCEPMPSDFGESRGVIREIYTTATNSLNGATWCLCTNVTRVPPVPPSAPVPFGMPLRLRTAQSRNP
jgi:hypothetical protein